MPMLSVKSRRVAASTDLARGALENAVGIAVTFAALMWWAEHGQGTSALAATRAAFRALAAADEPDAPVSPPATG